MLLIIGLLLRRVLFASFMMVCVGVLLGGCQSAVAPTAATKPPTTKAATLPTSRAETAIPTRVSTQATLGAADHVLGPDKAFLTIAVYDDFQCTACVDIAVSLLALRERYPDDVRIIWRPFPQPNNDKSRLAAEAAEAASDQDRFWEMHDLLFANQTEWIKLTPEQFRAKLSDYAKLIGVADLNAFNATLDSHRYANLIEAAYEEAQALDFKGVPVLLFNGIPYSGRIDEYALDSYTRLRLLEKRWVKMPGLQIDINKHYTATMVTEKGNVTIELYPKAAPVAVNNFVYLARQGWYDNITFHLVRSDLVQTGDPSGSGYGTAGYNIVDEFNNGLLFDKPGVVAMANSTEQDLLPNSASCQFFITLEIPQPADVYNQHYTIFGQVTQGLDVLSKLRRRDPFDDKTSPNPPPGDKLISIKIAES